MDSPVKKIMDGQFLGWLQRRTMPLAFVAAGHLAVITAVLFAAEPTASPAETAGWQSALEPRPLRFPADYAAHEDFRIEWWYYTGNLRAADGHEFGYELTFFRGGPAVRPEKQAVRDLYMVHFAISDVRSARFRHFQRLAAAGMGAAGAAAGRYRVWNGNRLATSGKLSLEGKTYEVTGLSWMDHEFSSSFLEPGQQGWDWLSLQLEDNRELMLYHIRRSDGRLDPFSSATLVDAHGHASHPRVEQSTLVPGSTWHSPQTGGEYPIGWTVRIPDVQLDIRVEAAFAAQEFDTLSTTGLAYWEGTVRARGIWAGQPVRGRGYLEMTGYAGKSLGSLLGGAVRPQSGRTRP